MAGKSDNPTSPRDGGRLQSRGQVGILFADLSGYTQMVYHCAGHEERMRKLSLAIYKLFKDPSGHHPHLEVEGYMGDGFLAIDSGPTPAKTVYEAAQALHERFVGEARSLFMDMDFRVSVSLRTALHVGRAWTLSFSKEPGDEHAISISDAINQASRLVSSQTCRRFGTAVSRQCYRRLLRLGTGKLREPDEVIQDRNKYPEPIDVYRLRSDEEETIAGLPAANR